MNNWDKIDITMCTRKKCPRAKTCLRRTATPIEYQSWACFDVTKDAEKCEGYIDNDRIKGNS